MSVCVWLRRSSQLIRNQKTFKHRLPNIIQLTRAFFFPLFYFMFVARHFSKPAKNNPFVHFADVLTAWRN